MTTEETRHYEESLLALKDQLSHEIKDVIQGTDLGDNAGDGGDLASDEVEERGIAHAEAIALKDRLHRVMDALERIKAGTYGTCESCKGAIGREILEIDPESRLCKACKAAK
jgi:DnaK suppressor protein